MADRFTQFLMHPATVMGAGIMTGSDPRGEGLGGVGQGIMAANRAVMEREKMEQAQRAAALRAGGPDYSKSPVYFSKPGGGFAVGQLGPRGELHFPEAPKGYEPVRPVTQVQGGAGMHLLPYGQTGVGGNAGYIPRQIPPEQEPDFRRRQAEQTAAGTVEGRETEMARRQVSTAMIDARATLRRMNELRVHPGLATATGFSSWFPVVRGTDRADFEARMDQLTGGAFLQAYQMLRGGGQVTENEGGKAEQAIMRMRGAQSREDFLTAMDDYAEAVNDGIRKLQIDAGMEETGIDIPWQRGGPVAPVSGSGTGRLSRRQRRERLEEIRKERGR